MAKQSMPSVVGRSGETNGIESSRGQAAEVHHPAADAARATASHAPLTPAAPSAPAESFPAVAELRITRAGRRELRYVFAREGEAGKQPVAAVRILTAADLRAIEACCGEIAALLERDPDAYPEPPLALLRDAGRRLYPVLVPERIREALAETPEVLLTLALDEPCTALPWELLHDGTEFLCLRFAAGRVLRSARLAHPPRPPSSPSPPSEALTLGMVCDPDHELPGAATEREFLRGFCQSQPGLLDSVPEGPLALETVRQLLATCDAVHHHGLVDSDPADPARLRWLLAEGDALTSSWLVSQALSLARFPRVVVSHARANGPPLQVPRWQQVCGLAEAFARAGCKAWVGAVSPAAEPAFPWFDPAFYDALVEGKPVGVALRDARRKLAAHEPSLPLAWARYILVGDPATRLVPSREETPPTGEPVPSASASAPETANPGPAWRPALAWAAVALAGFCLAFLLWQALR